MEPFGRGQDPRAGSGMGLAICRKVVAIHGGAMGLESAPGEGSTFWFELPR
jgi:signal transduction histidine kinase